MKILLILFVFVSVSMYAQVTQEWAPRYAGSGCPLGDIDKPIVIDASELANGFYLYRLQAGSFIETKKMILIK